MQSREDRLSAEAFRGAPVALAIVDANGCLSAVNRAFVRLWGHSESSFLIGQRLSGLDHEPLRIDTLMESVRADGGGTGEIHATRPDGKRVAIRVDLARVGSDRDGVVLAAFEDVTELHVVETTLRTLAETTAPFSREAFLGAIVDAVVRTLDTRWVFVGELAPDDPPRVHAIVARENGEPMAPFDYLLEDSPCADVVGKKACLLASGARDAYPRDRFFEDRRVEAYVGVPLFGADGKPLGLLVALHDARLELSRGQHALLSVFASRVSAELERLRDEQRLLAASDELRRQSEILSRAQDSARLGGWEYRHDAKRLLWTDGLHRVLGTDPANVESTLEGFLAFVATSGRDRIRRRFVEPDPGGEPWSEEVEARTATGETVWLRLTGRALFDGATINTFGSAQDVTEARHSRLERQRLFDLSADMMCIAGVDGYFKLVNPAFEATLGWSPAELLARPWLDFVHPDDRDVTGKTYERILSGAPIVEFENRYRRKDGSWCWLEWRSTPILEGGFLYAIARDVTRRKAMEDQLRHAQKLEAVGRLAGGIAHDFNNLLTAILGGVEVAARDVPEGSPSRRHLDSIRSSAERAKGLTRQLLTFARRQVVLPKSVDVAKLVKDVAGMLGTALGEDIDLQVDAPVDLWPIRIDPGQLEQVLLNLAVNARDAMPRGGTLRLELDNARATTTSPAWPGGPSSGDWVRLRVTDSGLGIPLEIQRHVFEPFFSTKPPGQGTGLGLATCHGIVEQNRGHITFHSQPGLGTTFTILLPRETQDASIAAHRLTPRAVRGGETVLVVEDEPGVRELVKEILGGAGYRVLAAADGDEALRVARDHAPPIDLLFTDVVLPRRSGWDVAEILLAERPALRVLFSSGYAEDAMKRLGVPKRAFAFLPKPYTPQVLLARIRAVLDGEV